MGKPLLEEGKSGTRKFARRLVTRNTKARDELITTVNMKSRVMMAIIH